MERLHGREVKPLLLISNEALGHLAGNEEGRGHTLPLVGMGFLAQKELQSFWGGRRPDTIAWWFGVSEQRGLLGLSQCADPKYFILSISSVQNGP